MNIDHKVTYRSYETLLAFVMALRQRHEIDHLCEFRVRELIECYVSINPAEVQKTNLVLFEEDREPYFNSLQNKLYVNKHVWAEAGVGEPLACFKLLHELAHILLHKHPEYSFSRAEHAGLSFIQDEESAEWQANVFAALATAPPYLSLDCLDRRSVGERFNYPSEFIGFWLDLRTRHPLKQSHSFCNSCGGHQLRISKWARCNTCGKISLSG